MSNENKIIDFSKFKRTRIRKTFGNGIELYNPTNEQKKEILKLISNSGNENDLLIQGKDIIVTLVPMLTNVYIDTENEELIDDIINDPSEIFEDIIDEISVIVNKIVGRAIKRIDTISELPEKEQNEVLGLLAENRILTEKESKIEKLKRELAELESSD